MYKKFSGHNIIKLAFIFFVFNECKDAGFQGGQKPVGVPVQNTVRDPRPDPRVRGNYSSYYDTKPITDPSTNSSLYRDRDSVIDRQPNASYDSSGSGSWWNPPNSGNMGIYPYNNFQNNNIWPNMGQFGGSGNSMSGFGSSSSFCDSCEQQLLNQVRMKGLSDVDYRNPIKRQSFAGNNSFRGPSNQQCDLTYHEYGYFDNSGFHEVTVTCPCHCEIEIANRNLRY